MGAALRKNKGRLRKPVPGTEVQKSIMIMWVFPLPKETGERCQEAVAGWLLWASSLTVLGLCLLVCKMDPKENPSYPLGG